MVAEIQNIVYGQYLPSLLGADSLLPPESNASSNSYSAEIDPSVSNSFATAVFRFGHSMVQDLIRLEGSGMGLDSAHAVLKDPKQKGRFFTELSSRDPPSYHLKDQFFDPTSHNHRTHFPDILRAFAHMPSQGCDLLFNADVREKLFLVMEERDGVLGNASMAIKVPDLAARYVRRVLALLISVDIVEREAIEEAYKGIGPKTFPLSGISTEVASTASPATTLSVATAA